MARLQSLFFLILLCSSVFTPVQSSPMPWSKLSEICKDRNLKRSLSQLKIVPSLKAAIESGDLGQAMDLFSDLQFFIKKGVGLEFLDKKDIDWKSFFDQLKTEIQAPTSLEQRLKVLKSIFQLSRLLSGEEIEDFRSFEEDMKKWGSPPNANISTPVDDRPNSSLVLSAEVERFYNQYIEQHYASIDGIVSQMQELQEGTRILRLGELHAILKSLNRLKLPDTYEWNQRKERWQAMVASVDRMMEQLTSMGLQIDTLNARISSGRPFVERNLYDRLNDHIPQLEASLSDLGDSLKAFSQTIDLDIDALEDELDESDSDQVAAELRRQLDIARTNWRVSVIAAVKDGRISAIHRLFRHPLMDPKDWASILDPDDKSLIEVSPSDEVRQVVERYLSESV